MTARTGLPQRRASCAKAASRVASSFSVRCIRMRYSSTSFACSAPCSLLAMSRLSRRSSTGDRRARHVSISAVSSPSCSPSCRCQAAKRYGCGRPPCYKYRCRGIRFANGDSLAEPGNHIGRQPFSGTLLIELAARGLNQYLRSTILHQRFRKLAARAAG